MHNPLFRLVALGVCLAAALTASISPLSASCPVTVLNNDTSSSPNARAPIAKFVYERAVYLIRPAEMAASGFGAGPVTEIGWAYFTPPGLVGAAPLKVYLQNTSDTTNLKSNIWLTAITGMTLVHDATTTLPDVFGPFDIPFSGGSAFTYTGGGLYVAFDWGAYTGTQSAVVSVSTNITLVGGILSQQANGAPPAVLGVASNFRPETRLGRPVPATNVGVDYVIAMGAVPLGLVGAQTIQATVFQSGDADLTDVPVTLDITGAETGTETVVVPTLGRCRTQGSLITFMPFTPTVVGADALTVSVPADAVPVNDTLARPLDATVNRLSFEHAGVPPDAGLGFPAGTGELVARFDTTAPTQVDTIAVSFFAPSATKYRLVIRADDGFDKPGAQLYLDAVDRSVTSAGTKTIVLASPVAVGDTFYVGIRQTNTTNAGFSVNDEFPLRGGTFFYSTTPDAGPWTDMSVGPSAVFLQLNVGVTLGNCLVPLAVDVTPDTASACVGSAILFTASPSGSAPFTYRWKEDGVDIPGATNSTYSATKAAAGSHSYNCRVTDAGGCAATLDVTAATGTWVAPTTPPETAAGPGPANELVWPTGQDLVWPPNPSAATYTLYRGVRADLPKLLDAAVDSCKRYTGAAAGATGLTEVPSSGDFYWYLVTGTSVCGNEGSAGPSRVVNSSGVCP